MSYDVYGEILRKGYCEVHPDMDQPYPCDICLRGEYDRYKQSEESKKQEEEYEKKIIQDYLTMVETNKAKFQVLLNDLKRLSRLDTDIKEVFDILEPIIDSHCSDLLPIVEFDTITYNRIYKVLSSIRTDKNCIEELKKVIICEI